MRQRTTIRTTDRDMWTSAPMLRDVVGWVGISAALEVLLEL